MKNYLLHIVLLFCFTQLYSQEDGVVAFAIPVRNSLKFNRYIVNPTFSFVREQNKYISFYNKSEWTQFENAPQTYLFSYSGRFDENIGVGVGLFQQNFGVLTNFGGVLNFAYNAILDRDSNLTFGLNLGAYSSGINQGNVITNFSDPSLANVPSNFVLTVNPGINYGTTFLDFGVSINNLVSYNITSSKLIEDNPEQSLQGHIMYTGYINSRGFFDNAKFSSLIRSEFKKDITVLSGNVMLSVPSGIWAQAGYNSLYGVSAGLGLNITSQIAIEYNFEKAIGDLSTFGNSHDITLAYKFKKNYRYNYSDDDEEGALLTPSKTVKRAVANKKSSSTTKVKTNTNEIVADKISEEIPLVTNETNTTTNDSKTKLAEEAQNKINKEIEEKVVTDSIAKAEEKIKLKLAEDKVKADEAEKATIATEAKAKEDARLVQEAKVKAEEAAKLKLIEDRIKVEEIEKAKIAAEAKAKEDARLAQEAKVKAEEEAKQKLLEEEARIAAETQKKAEEAKLLEASKEVEKEILDETQPNENIIEDSDVVTKLTEDTKIKEQELVIKLEETLANKQQDLNDLKEENDLSEQGIYKQPKAFKSISSENAALESLKLEIDQVIKSQDAKISELENLYKERAKNKATENDSISMVYLDAIEIIKKQKSRTAESKANFMSSIETIKLATEFERKRRIKRAAYDNEEDRYNKDMATLNIIKQNTPVSSSPLKEEDFDFGEEQTSNIQIVKDIKNVQSGYYMVIAVHNDVEKRDAFLTKAVASGQSNINFFYDVNSSKYFIYYDKFEDIESAQRALQTKGNQPYNSKMSMVKIEN